MSPTLAWAKWIEALGETSPAIEPGDEIAVDARLRAATEAARQARVERESARLTPPAERGHQVTPVPERIRQATPVPESSGQPPALEHRSLPEFATPLDGGLPDLGDEPLPLAYGEDRITLLCKDPYWLHAYWEVTELGERRAIEAIGRPSPQLSIRVHLFNLAGDATPSGVFDVAVSEGRIGHWYLWSGRPGASFEVEIGFRAADGRFAAVARSQRVTTPRDRVSDLIDEEWMILTGEQERTGILPAAYRPGGGSLEVRELVAGRGLEAGSGAVSSFGGARPDIRRDESRPFWFVLESELVIYGATEPGARVHCQGEPVSVRSDGTFTLRFALPDGARDIPCTATSADGEVAITITPRIEKQTSEERRPGTAPSPAVEKSSPRGA